MEGFFWRNSPNWFHGGANLFWFECPIWPEQSGLPWLFAFATNFFGNRLFCWKVLFLVNPFGQWYCNNLEPPPLTTDHLAHLPLGGRTPAFGIVPSFELETWSVSGQGGGRVGCCKIPPTSRFLWIPQITQCVVVGVPPPASMLQPKKMGPSGVAGDMGEHRVAWTEEALRRDIRPLGSLLAFAEHRICFLFF